MHLTAHPLDVAVQNVKSRPIGKCHGATALVKGVQDDCTCRIDSSRLLRQSI